MKAVAKKRAECRNLNLVIRHDLDCSILSAPRMMEIERQFLLRSVLYIDVHSAGYTPAEAAELYYRFSPLGFNFGIHINVAYHYQGEEACLERYDADLSGLRALGIVPHSCVAHYYPTSVAPIPEYHNGHIERWSTLMCVNGNDFYPPSFKAIHFRKQPPKDRPNHLTDGGGFLPCKPENFLTSLQADDEAWLSFHPVYFEPDGDDLRFIGHLAEETVCETAVNQ